MPPDLNGIKQELNMAGCPFLSEGQQEKKKKKTWKCNSFSFYGIGNVSMRACAGCETTMFEIRQLTVPFNPSSRQHLYFYKIRHPFILT